MGVFKDGDDSNQTSEESIRKAIEQSGTALADKLAKLIAGMPHSQVVRILGGEKTEGVDDEDAESLRLIAKRMGSSKVGGSSNFDSLGKDQSVEAGDSASETIRLLEQMEEP